MTEELYDLQETETAIEALGVLTNSLPEPFVVLGGWAVYLTASESYKREHGTPYLGSRDVDVGFHIDPTISVNALRHSTFSKAIEVVRSAGYYPMGSSRYCKFIRKGTGEILTEEEARRVRIFDLFYLYLDMMVDHIHPKHYEVFDIKVLDEPILARIFDEGNGVTVNVSGNEVVIPPPHLLLASKLISIPKRQKDDKILKDACDIYAIIWHSPEKYDSILTAVQEEYPRECEEGLRAITDDVARNAARHLGIDVEQYLDMVRQLRK